MLDVHLAHGAVRGWRDFFVHIATIAIGLCLALGLEQTRAWRRTVAELQSNLLVFEYLQQHPGTAQERLPGVLLWRVSALSFSTAAWDAARESGVLALMPRQELEQYTDLYGFLDREWDMAYQAVLAVVEAERYNLSDSDPSRLAPGQIGAEIELLEAALGRQWLQGSQMENLVTEFPDFPAAVTRAELQRLRHSPDEETLKRLGPAQALTTQRLKAAGFDEPVPSHR